MDQSEVRRVLCGFVTSTTMSKMRLRHLVRQENEKAPGTPSEEDVPGA